MTDTGTTQDNFILPAPPVGGLPISQNWLDKMKLVYDRTIRIILPSGKNILVNMVFKINIQYTKPDFRVNRSDIGYTNLDSRKIQSRHGRRVCLFISPNANMAGYPTKQ